MSKEEKIREAYIAEFTEGTDEQKNERYENIKSHIDSFGWFCGNVHKKHEENFDISGHEIRPKSLNGIENNNGWIKIESEKDLPKENKSYWILMNGVLNVGKYQTDFKKWLVKEHQYFENYTAIGITHFQEIQKPELPIY